MAGEQLQQLVNEQIAQEVPAIVAQQVAAMVPPLVAQQLEATRASLAAVALEQAQGQVQAQAQQELTALSDQLATARADLAGEREAHQGTKRKLEELGRQQHKGEQRCSAPATRHSRRTRREPVST